MVTRMRRCPLAALLLALIAVPARADDLPAGPSSFGPRGLQHAWSAETWDEGSWVLGASLEASVVSDFLVQGDENRRLATRLSLAGVPVEGLELSAGFSLVMNHNTASSPDQQLSIGDPFLGLRYGGQLDDSFSLGVAVHATLPNAPGTLALAPEATSVRLLATADYRATRELLFVLNVGFHVDNSAKAFEGTTLTAAQAFAGNVNPHNQVMLNLGGAYQFGRVAPFLEWTARVGVGDGAPPFADTPHWLTVGVRAWPLAERTLNLLAAVDIGTGATGDLPSGMARVPAYNVVLAAGWDFGAVPESLPAVTEVTEVVKVVHSDGTMVDAGTPARIAGSVYDDESGDPVLGARVTVFGEPRSILISDPEDGTFLAYPGRAGQVKVVIAAEGYAAQEQQVIAKRGTDVDLEVRMERAKVSHGLLKGFVVDGRGKPLAAQLTIPSRQEKAVARAKDGGFELRAVTGEFDLIISHEGFVGQKRRVRLSAGEEILIEVELAKRR